MTAHRYAESRRRAWKAQNARRKAARAAMKQKPRPLGMAAIRARVIAKAPRSVRHYLNVTDESSRDCARRRLSLLVAAELRRLGLLTPDREGYAPGSWAAK